jgi:uncharacterized protein
MASRLAYPEVRAALAASARNHDITEAELDAAEQDWDGYWGAIRPVELTAAVERHAGQLARAHALRGADAVHLASALAIADPELIIAVWDHCLHAGVRAAGGRVARPSWAGNRRVAALATRNRSSGLPEPGQP